MATTESSDNYTKELALATTGASNRVDMGEIGAPMLVLADSVTLAAEAATSTITFASLPLGARIWNILFAWEDLSTANTIQLGVTGNTDLFYGAQTASAVGSVNSILLTGVGYTTLSNTLNVIATTSAHTATGTIKIVVQYTLS